MELRLFPLDQVYSGDTYEIAHSGPYVHWSPDSLYFHDDLDTLEILGPHVNMVFGDFNWYGPQKVTLEQWKQVERRCEFANLDNPSVPVFLKRCASGSARRTWQRAISGFLEFECEKHAASEVGSRVFFRQR